MFEIVLSHTSGTITLDNEPQDFDETELFIRRDPTFHGLFFDFSRLIKFTCNGAGREYIQTIIDDFSIDAIINITVNFKCSPSDPFEFFIGGILNLSSWKKNEPNIEINIEESDLAQLIKNRGDIKVDLLRLTTMDGTALSAFTFGPYALTMHSKSLRYEGAIQSLISSVFGFSVNFGVPENVFQQTTHTVVNGELENTKAGILTLASGSPVLIQNAGMLDFHDTTNQTPVLLPGTYQTSWDISGDWIDSNNQATGRGITSISLDLVHGQSLLPADVTVFNIGTIPDQVIGSGTGNNTVAFSFVSSTNLALERDDKIWLVWSYIYTATTGVSPISVTVTIDYSAGAMDLDFNIVSVLADTTANAFLVHEAFGRVLQSITDILDPLRSDLLGRKNSQPFAYPDNGCASFTALTIGKQIRGFLTNPIPVSLNELFEAYNVIFNLGLGIEDGKIILEKKSFFYDPTVLLTIVDIEDLEISNAEELYYNEINIGYNNWEVEDVNGLDEFCTPHQYLGPIRSVKNEYDVTTDFITGPYPIELLRRDQFSDTSDSNYDDNKFFIALNRSVDGGGVPDSLDIAEKNENLTTINNFVGPSSIYNVRFSPKRCLLRHVDVLAGGYLAKPATEIQFQAGEGNTALETAITDTNCPGDFSGVLIGESEDLQWDSVNLEDGTAIWIPEFYTFTAPLTFDDFKTLRDNPKGVIQVSETSTNLVKCYIIEVIFRIGENKADFKLLRANL